MFEFNSNIFNLYLARTQGSHSGWTHVTTTLEKAWTWPRTNHSNDIFSRCELANLAIIGHIQQDLPLLIALVEHWDPDCNTFHLPPGEMTITLLDIYYIWGIPIRGRLVHYMEVFDNNTKEKLALWLIGKVDHDWEHQAVRLMKVC